MVSELSNWVMVGYRRGLRLRLGLGLPKRVMVGYGLFIVTTLTLGNPVIFTALIASQKGQKCRIITFLLTQLHSCNV